MTKEQILESLQDCDFEELSEDNFDYSVVDNVKCKLVNSFYGVTKGVLLYPDCDFVVKIPFGGKLEDVYDDDGDYEECVFSGFQFADDDETGNDYCKAELIKYEHARMCDTDEIQISKLFAPTTFLGYVKQYPIYIQPICKAYECVSEQEKKENSKEQRQNTVNTCDENGFDCFNADWLTDVIHIYGLQTFLALCTFLENEDIKDLHSGNIGYKDGKPILFDYSSFNDN